MKYLPLILKHLRRNWVRTTSTVLAMSVCIFLFCTLEHFTEAMQWGLKNASASRLVTRHNVSLVFRMPVAFKERIASVPGVRTVAISNWFGGVYKDPKNGFANFAVEAEEYFKMYPEYVIPTEQKTAFFQDLKGCVVGKELARKFEFKVGDVIQLRSIIPNYQKNEPFEFNIRGIYDTDEAKYSGTPLTVLFFHYKYLYEGTEQRAGVGTFVSEVAEPEKAAAVCNAIDALFENSDTPTKTETEAAFRASFVSMGGNLALLLRSIGLAVTFTILLVTANTMSMTVRERKTEIGIFKTLGFSDFQVLSIILAEAVLLGVLGGSLGILLGQTMIRILPRLPEIGIIFRGFPRIGLSPQVAAEGFAMAVFLGFAAGLVPAILSYKARVTQLLRQV